ncbi:transposase [bacterium]|nr:transposase [bacterium]
MKEKQSVTSLVKEIKRRTRRSFSSEEKIKIVLEGLRGEDSIKEVCRKYSIHENQYYKWSKDFIEAGKKRLNGDTAREANTEEVSEIRKENAELKETVAELLLANKVLKKTLSGLE